MSRPSISTPCPAPFSSSIIPVPTQGRRLSTLSTRDETVTSELDFTRAIQQEFHDARPRRRAGFQRKQPPVAIFEDVIEDQEMAFDETKGGKTLLSKPAQRMPSHRLSRTVEKEEVQAQPLKPIGQARRRSSIMPARETVRSEPTESTITQMENRVVKGALKKDPRRRTIFVPDDTTIMTIHPGANMNTTSRLDDTFQLPGPPPAKENDFAVPSPIEESTVEETRPRPRRPRMSLAAAPRRVPLQQMASSQNTLPAFDLPGPDTGKENSPPGRERSIVEEKKPVKQFAPAVSQQAPVRSRLFAQTAASQARQTMGVRKAVPLMKSQSTTTTQKRSPEPRSRPELSNNASANAIRRPMHATQRRSPLSADIKPKPRPGSSLRDSAKPPSQLRSWLAENGKRSRLLQYPVLSEDVAQPQLYEDGWLGHQEVALTELVNEIFEFASPKPEAWSQAGTNLRESILNIYHQEEVTTMHERLQASLLYGALARPKDAMSNLDPAQDLGLRKRFLGLWLDNYDEASLRAAAEVVFGRQVLSKTQDFAGSLEASESLMGPSKSRRALTGFLETFLVTVDDANEGGPDDQDLDGHRWRKMMIRSLMLIWLLDQAKASGAVSGCLFKSRSTKKMSGIMLNSFAGLMVPSIGDITRVLRHFDYEVSHVQDPLDEVVYRIKNLAVDLRDGIFLNRLVETLLFSPKEMNYVNYGDATVTIVLPDTTVLESAMYQMDGSHCPRILSQHMKMPCLGRAQKLHNVQVALSALAEYSGASESVARDITADDIVDGHREKTLSLLWSLVSNHGLEKLVDWDLLIVDTRRSGGEVSNQTTWRSSQTYREELLMTWASAHAINQGIHVSNWTTSFADGQAYKAVLQSFDSFFPAHMDLSKTTTSNSPARQTQLRSLGCSTAFINQLATHNTTSIPTKTTTVSNLAFLASRLLPLARRQNAAVTIQRAFRRRHGRTVISQRVALMRMAHACATVVQTQDRLVHATTVLQRAWRGVVDARISRLQRDVTAFQMLARGWSARREVSVEAGFGDTTTRVMGGW